MLWMLIILKILRKFKMKFHQIKMIDVARSTASKIAEVELSEIAEIRFVDVVFRFVVAVASIVYLIDFCFDALIALVVEIADVDASADVLIVLKWLFVSDIINLMSLVWSWPGDHTTDHVEMYVILSLHLRFFQLIKLWNSKLHQMWIYFVFNNCVFFFSFIQLILFLQKCLLMFCWLKFSNLFAFKRFVFWNNCETDANRFCWRFRNFLLCSFRNYRKKFFRNYRFWNRMRFSFSFFFYETWNDAVFYVFDFDCLDWRDRCGFGRIDFWWFCHFESLLCSFAYRVAEQSETVLICM